MHCRHQIAERLAAAFLRSRPRDDGQALEKRTFNVPVEQPRGSAVRCNRLLGVFAPLAPEYNMGDLLRPNELNTFVSQSAHVNPIEQSLAPAQQDRRDSDVQLIDETRTKILPDSVRSTADAHIHSLGCVARP